MKQQNFLTKKDCQGRHLKEGDFILYTEKSWNSFYIGKITRFTKKRVWFKSIRIDNVNYFLTEIPRRKREKELGNILYIKYGIWTESYDGNITSDNEFLGILKVNPEFVDYIDPRIRKLYEDFAS